MKQWQLPGEQWMKYYRPDLVRAKKLMADAGQAAGFTVKLGVIPTFPTMVSGAPVVAAQLKRIGITVEIENVEYAVWIKRWLAKDFDMTMNTTPGYADPDHAFLRALPDDVHRARARRSRRGRRHGGRRARRTRVSRRALRRRDVRRERPDHLRWRRRGDLRDDRARLGSACAAAGLDGRRCAVDHHG